MRKTFVKNIFTNFEIVRKYTTTFRRSRTSLSSKKIEHECSVNTRKNIRSLNIKMKSKSKQVSFFHLTISTLQLVFSLTLSLQQPQGLAQDREGGQFKSHQWLELGALILLNFIYSPICEMIRFLIKTVFQRRTSTESGYFFIIAQLLCPNFQANCLFQSKETQQQTFGRVQTY